MKTYAPDNLQAMSDQQLADAIARAEAAILQAQDYIEYLESCTIIRQRQLMPASQNKLDGWRHNLEVARQEQAERLAS